MKQNKFFTALAAVIMSLFALTGCNSDGDETISLEYGSVKKMIVGQWVVTGGSASGGSSRVLTFTDDGYYTDSSDGGTKRHPWRLSGSSSDDEPYYGGIYLDGQYYDITSMSDGNWVLTDKNGKTLELGRDGGGSGSQGSQNPSGGISGSVNTAYLVGSWKRVKQIDLEEGKEISNDKGPKEPVLTLTADGKCSVDWYRMFEAEIHSTVSYYVSGNFLVIDDEKYRIDKLTAEEMVLTWVEDDGRAWEQTIFQKVVNDWDDDWDDDWEGW